MPQTIVTVFGTRPEAVKMAPVVRALQQESAFNVKVVVTAQHREMLDQVMRQFHITSDVDLDIMQPRQTLTQITTRALGGLESVYADLHPDLVLAQGDTTTVFAAALAAFYARVPFGHIEAGLRTGDKYSPYPEEMNRRLAGVLTDLHFAPTPESRQNLLAEQVPADRIFVTGNTVIDALLWAAEASTISPELAWVDHLPGPMVLVTAHRRENWGDPLRHACQGMYQLLEQVPDATLVYAVHRNPVVRETAQAVLGNHPRVRLIEPPDYFDFVQLMKRARLILTDSGGIQEEAPSLGVPVLVLRESTERPEAVTAGVARLLGTDQEKIVSQGVQLLTDPIAHAEMAHAANPYGDGRATARIVDIIKAHFGLLPNYPEDFSALAMPESEDTRDVAGI
ncbi:MAG TPA: UDP-N-acetylglucosamine 2-epimerase (non-hydrolyzing) [Armatimonadota bacterium]|nr:UDP-N-acetylglucosamine 2-epimerase (non-hydrolyzing) [Armatimonadota bacterium]